MAALLRRQSVNLTLLLVGVAVALGAYALVRQGDAVQEACLIQARGLVANQHLSAFFVDWDRLIVLQRKQEAKALLKQPPAERQATQAALNEIHAFAVIQQGQPKRRTCP